MLYLNHAGTSWPKPDAVSLAVAKALAEPVESWPASFEARRRAVASAFAIAEPTRLLLTPGCTAALNVGIMDHRWAAGDRIVTSSWEHHALHRPVLELEKRGVLHVAVSPAGDEPLDLEALARVLHRGRVRLVAMCAAANVTGALLPVAEVTRLAHAHGALVLVDAAQTAGWIDIDVADLEVDLLAFAGHKGPQAPWGIGGLYVAPHVTMASPLATCAVPEPGEPRASCAPMPGYCDTGSVDRLALAGLVAGLAWLAAPERRGRLERARGQMARLAAGLRELSGLRLYGPIEAASRMPTIAFTVEQQAAPEVAAALRERGVVVSGGTQCAPLAHATLGTAPSGVVRISVGPTTPEDAVSRCLDAIADVLSTMP